MHTTGLRYETLLSGVIVCNVLYCVLPVGKKGVLLKKANKSTIIENLTFKSLYISTIVVYL